MSCAQRMSCTQQILCALCMFTLHSVNTGLIKIQVLFFCPRVSNEERGSIKSNKREDGMCTSHRGNSVYVLFISSKQLENFDLTFYALVTESEETFEIPIRKICAYASAHAQLVITCYYILLINFLIWHQLEISLDKCGLNEDNLVNLVA